VESKEKAFRHNSVFQSSVLSRSTSITNQDSFSLASCSKAWGTLINGNLCKLITTDKAQPDALA